MNVEKRGERPVLDTLRQTYHETTSSEEIKQAAGCASQEHSRVWAKSVRLGEPSQLR